MLRIRSIRMFDEFNFFLKMDVCSIFLAVIFFRGLKVTFGEIDFWDGKLDKNCTPYKLFLNIDYSQLHNTSREPNVSELEFWLYKEEKIISFNFSTAGVEMFSSPYFDSRLPVMIYTHGFYNGMDGPSVRAMTGAFLQHGGYNVIALDTKTLTQYLYLQATTNVRFIGEAFGKVLVDFRNGGILARNIHLAGHSLGAHISGFAGKIFYELTGYKIGRISGMDPAGPCFFEESSDLKLKKTDANFVDVIHSDAGSFGDDNLLGHVDFFPNGGRDQPGTTFVADSHSRSWELYSTSVNSPTIFPAVKCTNWGAFLNVLCVNGPRNVLGFGARPKREEGAYYLRTEGFYPFGMGDAGVFFRGELVEAIQKKWVEFLTNTFASIGQIIVQNG